VTSPDGRPAGRALLFHSTHIDNLPSIVRAGRLVADRGSQHHGLVTDVGAAQVKERRRRRAVPGRPGSVVADFVPFYFAPRSPMMFRIACDHRDGVLNCYSGGDDPLVYLVTSVDRIVAAGSTWFASDGNAAAAITQFTDEIADLDGLVDWPLMREELWADTHDDQDRQRRRMAEFLVLDHVPLALIAGYAVRTAEREAEVRPIVGPDPYVAVRTSWYYGYERRRGGRG
jgi:hypothetical protein